MHRGLLPARPLPGRTMLGDALSLSLCGEREKKKRSCVRTEREKKKFSHKFIRSGAQRALRRRGGGSKGWGPHAHHHRPSPPILPPSGRVEAPVRGPPVGCARGQQATNTKTADLSTACPPPRRRRRPALSHPLPHPYKHTELRRRQSNTTNHGSHRRHQEDGKKGDGVKREGRSAAAAGRSAARFCLPAAAGAGADRLLAPSTPRARQGRARRTPYRGGTQWYAAWHTQPAAHTPPRSGRRLRSPPLPSPSLSSPRPQTEKVAGVHQLPAGPGHEVRQVHARPEDHAQVPALRQE